MSSAREKIFASIRGSLEGREGNLEPYPDYEERDLVARPRLSSGDDSWNDFARNFSAVNGRAMDSIFLLMSWLNERDLSFGYCAPELYRSVGRVMEEENFEVSCKFDRSIYEDYQFGITKGSGVIAETGTVILTDRQTSDRLGALVPWVHVAVVDSSKIYQTISDAIAQFGDHSNIIWATGPSKTADVEGILIEGVHGPGEQICLCLGEI